MALFGHNLLGEVLLNVLFISLGYSLAFVIAARASRSLMSPALTTLFAIAIEPRFYNYDEVLLYVLGIFLCWRY